MIEWIFSVQQYNLPVPLVPVRHLLAKAMGMLYKPPCRNVFAVYLRNPARVPKAERKKENTKPSNPTYNAQIYKEFQPLGPTIICRC